MKKVLLKLYFRCNFQKITFKVQISSISSNDKQQPRAANIVPENNTTTIKMY